MTENSGFETPLLNEHMLLGAVVENGEKGFASKAVVYGDGTAERDALRDGCGVADLSYLRMMLIGGDAAESSRQRSPASRPRSGSAVLALSWRATRP